MHIPTVSPSATITQITSTVASIVTSTPEPTDTVPDIVKICRGEIFCVMYLNATPWTAKEVLVFLREFVQALVVALVSVVSVMTMLYFIIEKMSGGRWFQEIPPARTDLRSRMTSTNRYGTLPRYRPQLQTSASERTLLLGLGFDAPEGMVVCYNTWPKARSRRTSITTLKTIIEAEEEEREIMRRMNLSNLGPATRTLVLPNIPNVPVITLTPVQSEMIEEIWYSARHLSPEWSAREPQPMLPCDLSCCVRSEILCDIEEEEEEEEHCLMNR